MRPIWRGSWLPALGAALAVAAAVAPALAGCIGPAGSNLSGLDPLPAFAGTGPCPADGVCFFAMGDTGTGDGNQAAVAQGIRAKCAADGCAFGLLLGDLIYDRGATSPADPQFQSKFEEPYSLVTGPFYAALGNHDYNATGNGQNWGQESAYLGYASSQPKFLLPGGVTAYSVEVAPVLLLGLDTQQILYDPAGAMAEQALLASGALAVTAQPWRIAFGHHPYLSNGPHGNAGAYDSGAAFPENGRNVKDFVEANLCGQVDVYLSGHDHSRQVFAPPPGCLGTTFVVSGAGARLTGFPKGNTPAPLFSKSSLGFAYFRVTPGVLHIEMLARNGAAEYSLTLR
jgi:hypothetical protein